MAYFHPAWLQHRRRRWMPPSAERWIRPHTRRWMRPSSKLFLTLLPDERKDSPEASAELDLAAEREELLRLKSELAALKAEIKFRRLLRDSKAYNPNQPRVPAGSREGGQWTSGGDTSGNVGRNDPRVMSDATPDNDAKPGAQYAQNRGGRGSVQVRIGGQVVEVEPGQAARLAVAEARAQGAIRRVRELDPNWRPRPSAYGTGIESEIRKSNDLADEAQARASELARVGIGPGPFAGESLPARGPERTYNAWERSEGRRIFSETGCHTCGTFEPGTLSGNPVLDHQPPNALNPYGRAQRLYPQCLTCSLRQGGWITSNNKVR